MRKVALFWSPDMDGVKGVFPRNRSWQAKVFGGLHQLSYYGIWILFLVALWRRHPPSAILPPLLYYSLVYAVIVAAPRYHFPAMPWLVMGAAAVALPRNRDHSPAEGGAPAANAS